MSEVTEFVVSESVTATIHMTAMPGCESFQGPLHIGHYAKSDEVFLECEGARINMPAHLIKSIIMQIRRAEKIAHSQKEQP